MDIASPESDTLILALVVLGVVAVVLAVALFRRTRDIQRVRDLGDRLHAVAPSGHLAARLAPHAHEGDASELAEGVDRLIERLQAESSAREERESVYRRL